MKKIAAADSDTIVVTATKREKTLQEVPIAVSVIDGQDLDRRNASGFGDYLTSVPGVQYNQGGSIYTQTISIRGVNDPSGSGIVQAHVALYLDGTSLTLSQGSCNLDYSVYGVDQVSVIKGPHSTLYGAASLGGTIKVETTKPSLTETSGRAKTVVSGTEEGGINYDLIGSFSTPLVEDVLGLEVTGYYRCDAGFIDDPANNEDNINDGETIGGRVALRFVPTENLTIDGAFSPPPPINVRTESDTQTDFSPRVALDYETDNGSIYAQASRGFRVGQANVPIVSAPTDNVPEFFEPDSLWNYEIGAKNSFFDRRLQTAVAVYYIDWQDIQQNIAASSGFTFVDNLGSVGIIGVEVEATVIPTDNTLITFGITYNDAELEDDVPGVARAGQELPGVPTWQFSSLLEHSFVLGNRDSYIGANYVYYGEFNDFFEIGGVASRVNGDYNDLSVRFGTQLTDQVELQIFGTNILDERPVIARNDILSTELVSTLRPRTTGVSFNLDF